MKLWARGMGRATWFPQWVMRARARVKAIILNLNFHQMNWSCSHHCSAHLASNLASLAGTLLRYALVYPMTVHVRHVACGSQLNSTTSSSST